MLGSLSKAARIALLAVALPAASPAPHWFSTRGDPLFADARAQIQVLVDADGRHVANRFCVVGNDVGGGTYRLTRATADRILLACRRTGTRYLVTGAAPAHG